MHVLHRGVKGLFGVKVALDRTQPVSGILFQVSYHTTKPCLYTPDNLLKHLNEYMFIQGLILGFSIAAPVGPIGVLCIRRTLANGRLSGLFSGLGAASADAIYGLVAAYGLTVIASALVAHQNIIRLAGGLFLLYLGIRIIFSVPATISSDSSSNGLLGDYLSSFALTLTNPMTIISFGAVFAGLGLAAASAKTNTGIFLVAGVFIGSAIWWLLLSSVIAVLRNQVGPRWMTWINRISGVTITTFGLIALASIIQLF